MKIRFSAFFTLICAASALTLPWGVTGSAVAQNRAPAAQRQRPNGAGSGLIQKLEAQLGAPLSVEQKRQIAEAIDAGSYNTRSESFRAAGFAGDWRF
jgi:hypothetical protein